MKQNKIAAPALAFIIGILSCISFISCVNSGWEDDVVTINPGTVTDTASPTAEISASSSAPAVPGTAVPTDAPTRNPEPTAVNSAEPIPGKTVSIGTADMPARFTMPTELYGVSEAECEKWFADAMFAGDSLTLGWKNYNSKMLESKPDFFGPAHFFCEGSYGAGHALEPISDKSLHPLYGGEQHYIWDAAALMKAKKVFLLFGLNDIVIYGVDGTVNNFAELICKIKQSVPDAEIYIISAMYMYRGSEMKTLNNKNIYALNRGLAGLCNEKGCEFINIAGSLIDENGFVPDEYSSDKYVHQTYKAYKIWAEILRSVAARHILEIGKITFE